LAGELEKDSMGCGLEKGPEKNECRRQQAEDGEEKMNI
jgi:hypothetical protein